MTKQLEGKIALITGGTSGIGLATAQLFADEGARVIATGSNPASIEAARAQLGGRVEFVRSDASDVAAIDQLFAHIQASYGALDIAFLNAGIVGQATLDVLDEKQFDDMFRINVKGPFFAVRGAIPLLRPGGAIILNSSISGSIGRPGTAVYAGSKAALRALGRVAAAELAAKGIRVNVISPGPTESGILEKHGLSAEALDALKQSLIAQIPQRRMGSSAEVARSVLFLASDASSFVTGEELVVDGGMTRV